MFLTIQSVGSLLLAAAMLMLGNGLMSSLVGVRLDAADTPAWLTGSVGAAYFGGTMLGSLNAYRTITSVGHIRSFTAFASLYSAAMLLHAIVLDPVLWLVLRLIGGYCMAGMFMCLESWLNDRATPENRGRMLSFYMMAIYAAMGLAQGALALPDGSGFLLFVLASLVLSLSLVPIALTRLTQPVLPDISSFSIARLYEASPLGLFGTFVSGLTTGAFYALGAVYAQRSGLGLDQIALFMATTILSGLVLQWPIGLVADRFDRRRVIVGLFAALALASVAMVATTGAGLSALLVTSGLYGAIASTVYPMCVAYVNDRVDPQDRTPAAGGLILAYSTGAVIGPVSASAIMAPGLLGPPGLFAFNGLVAMTAVIIGIFRMFVRESVPLEDQAQFQIAARTTPAATALDTRGEDDDQYSFDFENPMTAQDGVETIPPCDDAAAALALFPASPNQSGGSENAQPVEP